MQKEVIPVVPRCRECLAFLPYEEAPHPEQETCSLCLGSIPSDPVEWTVYTLYAAYPTLFGRSPWSRWRVFDHLFFTLGGGYEWVDSELCNVVNPDGYVSGEAVPFQHLEEETKKLVESTYPIREKDAPRIQELLAQNRREFFADLLKEWAQLNCKPTHWYSLDLNHSNLGRLPNNVHPSWLLAACDATQMYLQGSTHGQSFHQIYKLIELRVELFARVGLTVPSLEENRMTSYLIREKPHHKRGMTLQST